MKSAEKGNLTELIGGLLTILYSKSAAVDHVPPVSRYVDTSTILITILLMLLAGSVPSAIAVSDKEIDASVEDTLETNNLSVQTNNSSNNESEIQIKNSTIHNSTQTPLPKNSSVQRYTSSASRTQIVADMTISRTPTQPDEVRIKYDVTLPPNVVEFNFFLNRSVQASPSIINKTGFSYTGSVWQVTSQRGSSTTATLTYDMPVGIENRFGRDTAETSSWAFVNYFTAVSWQYSGSAPVYNERHTTAGPGFASENMAFMGEYTRYTGSLDGEPLTVIVPDAASSSIFPREMISRLETASTSMNLAGPGTGTTGFILPDPIQSGGAAIGTDFWVYEDDVIEAGFHEYIHTEQNIRTVQTTTDADWFIEASAQYYGHYLQWQTNLLSDTTFRSQLLTSAYDGTVLQDGIRRGSALKNYEKGELVLAALDIRIRQQTGGNHSLETVFRRVNQDRSLSYDELRREVTALTGESTGTWLDTYVSTDQAPTIPESIDSAYAADLTTPPDAAFSRSVNNPVVGESVTFDASESTDPDGSIQTYEWDFDDDGIYERTGPTVTYTFSNSGDRTVALRITDDAGVTATTNQTITITERDTTPAASFTVSPGSPATGETVTFDASGSSSPDGSIQTYGWDFDDDGIYDQIGPTVTYTFSNSGDRTVTLYLTGDSGTTVTASRTVTVTNRDESDGVWFDGYVNQNDVVDPSGLNTAIGDYLSGNLSDSRLNSIISSYLSESPIEDS